MRVSEAPAWLRAHSSRIMTAGIVLALLYFGRSVLIPLALAIMLSLLVAPLVRRAEATRSRQDLFSARCGCGIGRTVRAVAAALGTQVLRIAESLPQYESMSNASSRPSKKWPWGRFAGSLTKQVA